MVKAFHEAEIEVIGIRPGEKLHEIMISSDDARTTVEYDDYFAILPAFHDWDAETFMTTNGGEWCPDGFSYSSDNNTRWLSGDEMLQLAGIKEKLAVA